MDASKQEAKELLVKAPTSFGRGEWTKIDKDVACTLFILHVLCIFAPFQFNWSAFWIAFVLYIITGLFGISISFHRNLSHKTFKIPKWLEYLFAYCGVHAFQGDPIDWVSTHRCHHQFVDTGKDPHSPVQGLWFSHIAWTFNSYALTKKVCPKYFSDFKDRERSNFRLVMKYGIPDNVGDLEKQTFYRFIHKTYLLHHLALAALLYRVGGIPFVIWGMCVRIVINIQTTSMVNSICHTWGKQPWNTGDLSKNNLWVSLITFGEGWHNNHHAFEYSARIGLEWWEFDFGWYVIMFLQAIGLATNVKVPTQTHKQRLAMNKPKEDLPIK